MSIGFGATSTGSNTNAGTLTFSSPNVSGSNTFGIVTVFVQTDLVINNVTWNGVSCTFIAGQTNDSANERLEMWYITAPTAGVTNIVISRTGGTNALNGYAGYWTGVSQTSQPEAFSNNHNSSVSTWTQSVTTLTNNAWTICNARNGVGAFTAGTGTTFRTAVSSVVIADSGGDISPAQAFSMSMTFAGSPSECYGQMISIAPTQNRTNNDLLMFIK